MPERRRRIVRDRDALRQLMREAVGLNIISPDDDPYNALEGLSIVPTSEPFNVLDAREREHEARESEGPPRQRRRVEEEFEEYLSDGSSSDEDVPRNPAQQQEQAAEEDDDDDDPEGYNDPEFIQELMDIENGNFDMRDFNPHVESDGRITEDPYRDVDWPDYIPANLPIVSYDKDMFGEIVQAIKHPETREYVGIFPHPKYDDHTYIALPNKLIYTPVDITEEIQETVGKLLQRGLIPTSIPRNADPQNPRYILKPGLRKSMPLYKIRSETAEGAGKRGKVKINTPLFKFFNK